MDSHTHAGRVRHVHCMANCPAVNIHTVTDLARSLFQINRLGGDLSRRNLIRTKVVFFLTSPSVLILVGFVLILSWQDLVLKQRFRNGGVYYRNVDWNEICNSVYT